MTADRAQHRINNMTRAEHERVDAFLEHGSFKAAALALGIHEKTVSRTWKSYSADIKLIIAEVLALDKKTPVH